VLISSQPESGYLTSDTVFVSEYLNLIFMMSISIISYPVFLILSVFKFESGHKYENKYDILLTAKKSQPYRITDTEQKSK
jgi:hypothetical protein